MPHHHNHVLGFQDRGPNVSLFHLILLQYRSAIQVKLFCFPQHFAAISSLNCSVMFFLDNVFHLHLTLSIRQGLRGDQWVLYNYIKARKQFQVFSVFVQIHCNYSFHSFSILFHLPLCSISNTAIS